MVELIRGCLPDSVGYFESKGLVLTEPGAWRTARCNPHGGSVCLVQATARINLVVKKVLG